MYEDIIVDRREGWTEIRLNRPEKMNAVRDRTAGELLSAFEEVEYDRTQSAILLCGDDKAFCTGVDTSEQKQDPDAVYENWRVRRRTRKASMLFRTLPEVTKPVIAVVEGYALGGGFELALLADMIVAGEGAQFGLPEAKLGLMPAGGGTVTLPRLIGAPLAKELMWTARRLSAREALALRIVNHVTEKGKAIDKARELVAAFAVNAPLSIMYSKQAVDRSIDLSLAQGMHTELDSFFILGFSKDREEGLASFREKRKPKFSGR